jgi:hypothetical protein
VRPAFTKVVKEVRSLRRAFSVGSGGGGVGGNGNSIGEERSVHLCLARSAYAERRVK